MIVLAAPSGAQTPDQASRYYEDALTRYDKKDVGGAIVQLKNALRLDPNLLAANVLLGRAELARGDAAAAEHAFAKALSLGVNRSVVALPLAQALFNQGKFDAVIERFPPETLVGTQRLEMWVLRGHAYKGRGEPALALEAFEKARALDPKFAPAITSQADLLAEQGKREEAVRLVDDALTLSPDDARIWNLKGSLAHGAGDGKAALIAYDKAVSLNPALADARVARASLLIDLGKLQDAEPDIRILEQESLADPRANYVRAVYYARKGDSASAQKALLAVANGIDTAPVEALRRRAPLLLLLGGLAHHGLGETQKARAYLEDYLRVNPGHVGASKVLGAIFLSQREYAEAIFVLEPAQKRAPDDAQLMTLLATAHMGRRHYATATDYLERALKTSGGAPGVQTTLGLSLVGAGRTDAGIDHLQQAFDKDPGQPQAGVALATLQLNRGQAGNAVAVMKAVTQRDPENVAAQNLLGLASAASGDPKAGRAAFEKAIALDKAFVPARLNIARLDFAEGNPAAARIRLQSVVKDYPKHAGAMYELATVEESAGNRDEAIRWLRKARDVNARDLIAATRLVDLYIRDQAPDKALEVAKESEALAPENLGAQAALARAYLALGDQKNAGTTLARMGRLAGFDAVVQTQIAAYQRAAGNPGRAALSLDKALSGNPDYLPAQAMRVEVDLLNGDVPLAEQRAKAIIARYPTQAVGYRLAADVAMARRDYAKAIEGYQQALEKESSSAGALRVFDAYFHSGDLAKATEFIETWLRGHPKDTRAMRAAAEARLRAGNLTAARDWYEKVLSMDGDDAAVLNNLANVLLRQGDRGALAFAEKAYRLAPKDGAVQDTLGWVLVQQGQVDAGLRHLREARLRSPENPEIRYHLAAALNLAGRKEEARRELEPALGRDVSFEGIADARKLLQALSGK